MRVGTRVRVNNPFQFTNPLEGIIVKEKTAPNGKKSCKVQLLDETGAIWLMENELEALK
ncbi:hypothetical protein [Bacillus sp. B15-48]|uniref:hypothetical protein n=1 Tax=Bacillus sp. B15-48 TaxID=1548601 RepID=UPI00193FDC06|nr:hypothetical protein [Bacillus sp. B15-48]MBM4764578.1 hypothetical protein [Bacillus sp. B15-48]